MKIKKILFVCTGNSCRSPMAEGMLKKMLEGKAGVDVFSAGTMPFAGMPASAEAVAVLAEEGIDISKHKSRQLSLADTKNATMIIAMTQRHVNEILSLDSTAQDKIFLLKGFDDEAQNKDLSDPIGQGKEAYKKCLEEIKRALPNIILEIFTDKTNNSIAIGSDHGGYILKEKIKKYLFEKGYSVDDFGCFDEDSVDYPDFGKAVAESVSLGKHKRGIVICTTGIGISIVANKVKGIRASLCHNLETARMSRLHNDANVLAMGANMVDHEVALKIVDTWLNTEFEGGRHQRRVDKIIALDNDK